jgi:hypothetical protein
MAAAPCARERQHPHSAGEAWLGEHPRVPLLYRPADSGKRHHPVATVWGRLKDQLAAYRLHGAIDALVAAIHGFFTTFTPADALRLVA